MSPALDWLLECCPKPEVLARAWRTEPESRQYVPTGSGFDAVILPELLGQAVRVRLAAGQLHPPATRLGDDLVLLLRAGSTWDGPGVPAALERRGAGSGLRLPHPDSLAWLTPPTGGRLPGFLPVLGAVRDVIWCDYVA